MSGFKSGLFLCYNLLMSKGNIIIFSLIILAVLLLLSSIKLQNYFYEIIFLFGDFFNKNPVLGVVIFLLLGVFSSMFSLFTSVPLVPVGIMAWGNFLTIILLLTGWMIGSIFAYYIGWYAIYPKIKNLVLFEKIEYYRHQLSKKLEFEIILMFRMAMPAEIASYALGSLKYHFGKYLFATFITELPFAVLMVYLGDTLIKSQFAIFLILLAISSIIMATMFYLFNKRLKENQ